MKLGTVNILVFAFSTFLFIETSLLEAQYGNNFTYDLSTTKTEYFEGETIPLFIRISNISNQKDSIFSFGELTVLHNLYIINKNGDSSSGYQFSWDDGDNYTFFQPGEVIEFYNNDITTYMPISGTLFFGYIPAGDYIVRGFIPNENGNIISNNLELTIRENIMEEREEFESIKKFGSLHIKRIITPKDLIDSVNSFVVRYPNSKFITKSFIFLRDFMMLTGHEMGNYVKLNLNAIKNTDISDSSYARLLTKSLYDFLDESSAKYSYTQNDFKFFIKYNPEINPIIREQLIHELEKNEE